MNGHFLHEGNKQDKKTFTFPSLSLRSTCEIFPLQRFSRPKGTFLAVWGKVPMGGGKSPEREILFLLLPSPEG